MARSVPISEWGKDHWSTLAYLETCAVDHDGYVDKRKMRGDGVKYLTRLRRIDPEQVNEELDHSDWDCLTDMMTEGLIEPAEGRTAMGRLLMADLETRAQKFKTTSGRNETRQIRFTAKGLAIAGALRAHKANGGNFTAFVPDPELLK
jgi:phosphate-selective porin